MEHDAAVEIEVFRVTNDKLAIVISAVLRRRFENRHEFALLPLGIQSCLKFAPPTLRQWNGDREMLGDVADSFLLGAWAEFFQVGMKQMRGNEKVQRQVVGLAFLQVNEQIGEQPLRTNVDENMREFMAEVFTLLQEGQASVEDDATLVTILLDVSAGA